MSRIGRKPIAIPKGVQVGVQGQQVEVKGPKGRLEMRVHELCSVKVADGKNLTFALGYSHPIVFALPDGVTAEVDKQTAITLRGVDKYLVGQTAARMRALRPPDSYKGKGVRFAGEVVRKKVGKNGAK